ncbi:MAG: glycosyltransferase, partial [Chloroflexi bacterium]|nr:glycosyltransferase [Chloroflexota bacterium]
MLPHHAAHDLRLYQIGNSADHAAAFAMLRCWPGVVVLHEPFLHTGYRYMPTLRPYQRELLYELGVLEPAAQTRWAGETDRVALQAAPLIRRLIDSSLGVIVHSQAARQLILQTSSPRAHTLPIAVISQPMPLPPQGDPDTNRSDFGWPADALLIGVPGTIDPTKEPHLMLRAFARLIEQCPEARLIFMGNWPLDYGLSSLVQELGISDRVEFMGRVEPLARLEQALAACDIIINLRRPTIGETSGTALRALAQNTSKYGTITTDLLNLMAKQGPGYIHAVATFESDTIQTNQERSSELRFPLVFIFPAEGTFWGDHPYCILDKAEWVSPEQAEAGAIFLDYLLSKDQQALAIDT